MLEAQFCIVCETALQGRQTKFCSIDCKNAHHQGYETQKQRGLERKLAFVKAAGGKCTMCGYRTNLSALVFHHTDPSEKEFKMDMRSLSNRTYKSVRQELDKCILLCRNCHAELHNPHLDLALLT